MPNTEIVRALVSTFNVNNYDFNAIKTNFTLQSRGGKDCIVASFDKGMDGYQCKEYLDSIKRKIVSEFQKIKKEDTNEVMLNTAKLIFDVKSFPFNTSKGGWSWDKQHGFKFVIPVDKGVIFNLKSHLASSLAKDVLEDMPTCSIRASDRKGYLWSGKFPNKELCQQFEHEFLSRMKERYENVPKNPLKVEGNSVYIKDVFDDARFIDSVTQRAVWLIGRDLQHDSKSRSDIKAFKDLIIEFINQSIGLTVAGFVCDFPLGKEEATVFTPVVLDNRESRILASKEALKLNYAFNGAVFYDLYGKTQGELVINGSSGVYGIDFSNPYISHCVITKIIESSVINKDHELSIDPELHFRALSPAHSPNGGLPNGYLSEARSESPTRNDQNAIKDSSRRGSEKKQVLHNPVNLAGTSEKFPPNPHLSSTAVSQRTGKCVSAAQNVQASTSAWSSPPPLIPSSGSVSGSRPQAQGSSSGSSSWKGANPWSSQSTSGNQLPQTSSFVSGPSSWKGAGGNVPAWTSAWSQPRDLWLSQGTQLPLQPIEPGSGCSFRQEPSQVFMVNESSSSGWKISNKPLPSNKLNDKEKKLIEALLYTFNLMNYTFGGVYTNFFPKDGKIVNLLHDNVDREKYLQAVRDYIIEEYCGTEEEARKVYDFDEFPFKLNYEEKQGKTVVANISSGALSNLKILFSQKFGKNVDAIDISAVKKVEKREKDEWVDRQLFNKDSLEEACEDCFPDEEAIEEACKDCFLDEEAMKKIPIAFKEGEYVLDRSHDTCEVKLLLREQLRRFKEEKELFKVLLYAFNYSNNNFDLPDTNFIVKNGKIASLIDDSVNVKEYLQKVRDETREEYCKDKKEAYDLDQFPFKFLSNCEKNQETTVVANISRGALLNLEKLFIYGYKEKVKIEKVDINIVKEAVKSKKHRLVERKAKEGIERKAGYHSRIKLHEAATASYPNESALEDIPIEKYEAGYHLKRTYENWETELSVKDLGYTEDRSKAGKVKSEDNKDSGISSGEATDAENVSSKAEATTSGYESMDCENPPTSDQKSTRGGSPKRTLELSMGMEELAISTGLDATKAEQHSPAKKSRSN